MPPEVANGLASRDSDHEAALTLALLELASDANVRLVEALAAALVNRLGARPEDALQDWSASAPRASSPGGLCEDGGATHDVERRLGLCRRVARRALRGSLADPTRGANAFHRVETNPAWARGLLPVAMYGPYLFYRC
jgi:N-acetylmuramoyl-L-alanine amidase